MQFYARSSMEPTYLPSRGDQFPLESVDHSVTTVSRYPTPPLASVSSIQDRTAKGPPPKQAMDDGPSLRRAGDPYTSPRRQNWLLAVAVALGGGSLGSLLGLRLGGLLAARDAPLEALRDVDHVTGTSALG